MLDEPSIGLHQRDNDRLLATLTRLRDLGNTVLVVEHDEDAIRAADYVVDMGPGAGVHGGMVVAEGGLSDILANPESLTGQYLSGIKEISVPQKRRKPDKKRMIRLKGASGNNLKSVDADIPLGVLTCVTGVSGGGKSTLILETLWKALSRRLHKSREIPAPHSQIEGIELLDKVVDIDQSPIGRTPRSNPATYTGAFTPIKNGLPACQKQNRAAIRLAVSALMSRAAGARPVRVTELSRSRCISCQMSMSPAIAARGADIIVKRWKYSGAASRLPMC